jgi:hypothetical protein
MLVPHLQAQTLDDANHDCDDQETMNVVANSERRLLDTF